MLNSNEVIIGSFKFLLQEMKNPECSDGSDFISDLDKFGKYSDLPANMAEQLIDAALEAKKLRAVVKLLDLADGKFCCNKGFDAYLKLTQNSSYEILDRKIYGLMLKAGYIDGLNILHEKLGYPIDLDSKSSDLCFLLAEFKFTEFVDSLTNGKLLSGSECSFGYRFQKMLDGNWEKLKKFHNVLECHPAILASEKAMSDLKRDQALVEERVKVTEDKKTEIARIQREIFSGPHKTVVSHSYNVQAAAKLDFSSDDELDSCNSSDSSGSNIEVSHELLRSVMAKQVKSHPRHQKINVARQ